MDHRRLSTGDALYMGITDLPVPVIDVPKDTPRFAVDPDEPLPTSAMEHALELGRVLRCRALTVSLMPGKMVALTAGYCCNTEKSRRPNVRDGNGSHRVVCRPHSADCWLAD
jgi:hypothetical protein